MHSAAMCPLIGQIYGVQLFDVTVSVTLVLILVYFTITLAALWNVFEKTGNPGWVASIPVLNWYSLIVDVAKLHGVWFLLSILPILVPVLDVYMRIVGVAKGQGFRYLLASVPLVWTPHLIIWRNIAKNFGYGPFTSLVLAHIFPLLVFILGFGSRRFVDEDEVTDAKPNAGRE